MVTHLFRDVDLLDVTDFASAVAHAAPCAVTAQSAVLHSRLALGPGGGSQVSAEIALGHELEEEAHGLAHCAHTQQADDIGMVEAGQ